MHDMYYGNELVTRFGADMKTSHLRGKGGVVCLSRFFSEYGSHQVQVRMYCNGTHVRRQLSEIGFDGLEARARNK
jgi:hypothetical protein